MGESKTFEKSCIIKIELPHKQNEMNLEIRMLEEQRKEERDGGREEIQNIN